MNGRLQRQPPKLQTRHRKCVHTEKIPGLGEEGAVGEDDVILRVIYDVGLLFRWQPQVERVKDTAGAWNGVPKLQVAHPT